jgi:hypothetical protein
MHEVTHKALTFEALGAHLETLGWPHVRRDASTYACVHPTDEGDVKVFVRLSKDWLVASVVPFLATRGVNSFELTRWLLRQNREDGDVVLVLELPTESLDASEIRIGLQGLLREAVRHRRILRDASSS